MKDKKKIFKWFAIFSIPTIYLILCYPLSFLIFSPELYVIAFLWTIFLEPVVVISFILTLIAKQRVNLLSSPNFTAPTTESILHCAKCGKVMKATDKYCGSCGAPFEGNETIIIQKPKQAVDVSSFDPIYNNTEDDTLEEFIKRELKKVNVENTRFYPADVLRRKNIFGIIFSVLLFIYISLIFFHLSTYIYIIGFILLFVFFKLTRRYNLIKYLKKEIKARPNEKISNIIMNVKNNFASDTFKVYRLVAIAIAIIAPCIIFMNPRIMYEKVENGYSVRFYTYGLTNLKSISIPATHNNEPVVSLRGNVFSNMLYLENVSLPDTIVEIRGQAFKNDYSLKEIDLPKELEYLGGGSFENCNSLKSISIPDTVTFMGGEIFKNASSLETVKLSENITEIRGDSFRDCYSLKAITIPDKVERIGGHAFYGNSSLSEVTFTPNSHLREIGSSAFRLCDSLETITLPNNVFINERAFKESPTYIEYFNNTVTNN